MDADAIGCVLECPQLFVVLLAEYGHVAYKEGRPLHLFRQLLAFCQREYFGLKPYMATAWDVVTRWELAEPMRHRPPLPEPLLHAMLGLAIGLGWKRFCLVSLLAFYCIARPGELLSARRRDVLTAQDLLSDRSESPYLFVKVQLPKTRRRGAHVQHCKFFNKQFLDFAEALLEPLQHGDLLYPGSSASDRRRWDYLLNVIGVGKQAKVTPGSLRGGGAVWAYRAGVDLVQLLWLMRLRHTQTLGYYLQEVAADSVLTSFDRATLDNVRILQTFFKSAVACK